MSERRGEEKTPVIFHVASGAERSADAQILCKETWLLRSLFGNEGVWFFLCLTGSAITHVHSQQAFSQSEPNESRVTWTHCDPESNSQRMNGRNSLIGLSVSCLKAVVASYKESL